MDVAVRALLSGKQVPEQVPCDGVNGVLGQLMAGWRVALKHAFDFIKSDVKDAHAQAQLCQELLAIVVLASQSFVFQFAGGELKGTRMESYGGAGNDGVDAASNAGHISWDATPRLCRMPRPFAYSQRYSRIGDGGCGLCLLFGEEGDVGRCCLFRASVFTAPGKRPNHMGMSETARHVTQLVESATRGGPLTRTEVRRKLIGGEDRVPVAEFFTQLHGVRIDLEASQGGVILLCKRVCAGQGQADTHRSVAGGETPPRGMPAEQVAALLKTPADALSHTGGKPANPRTWEPAGKEFRHCQAIWWPSGRGPVPEQFMGHPHNVIGFEGVIPDWVWAHGCGRTS